MGLQATADRQTAEAKSFWRFLFGKEVDSQNNMSAYHLLH